MAFFTGTPQARKPMAAILTFMIPSEYKYIYIYNYNIYIYTHVPAPPKGPQCVFGS